MMNKCMVNIMDCCMGGELLDYVMEKKRLTEDETRVIFLQLISGINYCHKEFSLIHRDLKLENVLIIKQKNGLPICKLADYGMCTTEKKSMCNCGTNSW